MVTKKEMKLNDKNFSRSCRFYLQKKFSMLMNHRMDSRDEYDYGWNLKGQRFHALKSGRCQGRINMIAALCNQNLMATFTIDGACNRIVFETWLENCLLPILKPGQVIVMDNATFHKGGRIQQLIQDVGCHLLYLPPYSPDLNPIEKCWSWLTRSPDITSGACELVDSRLKSRIRHQ